MTTQAARQVASMPSERPTKVKSRDISRSVEAMLWGRAAGRCQFDGCNRPLWKSPVTQERVNLAEKAHIYSFSTDGPRGNRGVDAKRLNALENLILVCDICHKTIDRNWSSDRYTIAQLQQWKAAHEARVARVTGIGPEKSSHILLFGSNIGDHQGPLHYRQAVDAVFPHWYPAEDHAIELGVRNSVLSEAKEALFWDPAHAEPGNRLRARPPAHQERRDQAPLCLCARGAASAHQARRAARRHRAGRGLPAPPRTGAVVEVAGAGTCCT